MRLIGLHIENFGVLSDVDLDFKDGVNTIIHENGWGKSTLAEFIRVMFYGLEGARKKDLYENDRLRFQPWNGKHFGGEITFETKTSLFLVFALTAVYIFSRVVLFGRRSTFEM